MIVRYDEQATGVSKQAYLDALNAEGLYSYVYLPRPVNQAPRLSPDWSGARVMWTENLKRAGYDPTQVEVPNAEAQIRDHFNLIWNYIDYEPAFIQGMVDVFHKVEQNLDALRAYEPARGSA